MTKNLKIFIVIIVLGLLIMTGIKFLIPWLQQRNIVKTSDIAQLKGVITIGVDSWVGYYPLCSKELSRRMRGHNYLIKCIDDQADYKKRFQDLSRGELSFATATVDSYLSVGQKADYPATIIAIIDQSKGGDGIVSKKTKVASLDQLKTKTGLKIAYTPGSPSDFLIRAAQTHFDIRSLNPNLKKIHHIHTNGAQDALTMFIANKVDIAVLWEPEFTRARQLPDAVTLLSTKDTKNLIVDVLLVSRRFAKDEPEAVRTLLGQYYQTLKVFRDNPQKLAEELATSTKLSEPDIKVMLQGVDWVTLHENAHQWFGIDVPGHKTREDIIDTIDSALEILKYTGALTDNPLPQENPYSILNSSFIGSLFDNGISPQPKQKPSPVLFQPLDAAGWKALVEVGTLKIRPITFRSGTSQLNDQSQGELKQAARHLAHYPHFRVIVRGHTGLSGDKEANQELSEKRAEAVQDYLISQLNIDRHRIRAEGYGSQKPLPREPGESERAYNYRLPRVELYLMSESL